MEHAHGEGQAGHRPVRVERRDGVSGPPGERLFVVRVSESCCEPLAGRAEAGYESPPQPLEAARALVALLAGRDRLEELAVGCYAVAIAGGRRTITLEAAR